MSLGEEKLVTDVETITDNGIHSMVIIFSKKMNVDDIVNMISQSVKDDKYKRIFFHERKVAYGGVQLSPHDVHNIFQVWMVSFHFTYFQTDCRPFDTPT